MRPLIVAFIALVIFVGVALALVGLVIKGLFWLATIGGLLVVGSIVFALFQALRSTRPPTNPRV